MVVGYLDLSSWVGISIGARHWYCKLIVEEEGKEDMKITVQQPMTTSEAKRLNLERKERGYLIERNKAGDPTDGFDTKEDAIAAGIAHFVKNYQGVLFDEDNCSCSAWKNVIFWPEQFAEQVKEMNALAKRFQSLNGYEYRREDMKRVERLDEKWQKLYFSLKDLCKASPAKN